MSCLRPDMNLVSATVLPSDLWKYWPACSSLPDVCRVHMASPGDDILAFFVQAHKDIEAYNQVAGSTKNPCEVM